MTLMARPGHIGCIDSLLPQAGEGLGMRVYLHVTAALIQGMITFFIDYIL